MDTSRPSFRTNWTRLDRSFLEIPLAPTTPLQREVERWRARGRLGLVGVLVGAVVASSLPPLRKSGAFKDHVQKPMQLKQEEDTGQGTRRTREVGPSAGQQRAGEPTSFQADSTIRGLYEDHISAAYTPQPPRASCAGRARAPPAPPAPRHSWRPRPRGFRAQWRWAKRAGARCQGHPGRFRGGRALTSFLAPLGVVSLGCSSTTCRRAATARALAPRAPPWH